MDRNGRATKREAIVQNIDHMAHYFILRSTYELVHPITVCLECAGRNRALLVFFSSLNF